MIKDGAESSAVVRRLLPPCGTGKIRIGSYGRSHAAIVEEGRQPLVDVTGLNGCQTNLPQVVLALGPVGRLADFLYGRKQHADQDADDGDDDEQLNQRETRTPIPRMGSRHEMAFQ